MVGGVTEGGFFEEDESPEAVARLAAHFGGPRRYVRDELTEVVRTLRRQSERKVREGIVRDIEDHIEVLRARAWQGDGVSKNRSQLDRARLEELARVLHMVRGYPGRGWALEWTPLEYFVTEGHVAKIRGMPGGAPVGYEVGCSCRPGPFGWSVMLIGAKRLARRHAGLM